MIVADKKPIEEIIEEIKDFKKILILGCNECVTVCEAGGKKEVGILASALRMYFLNEGKLGLKHQMIHHYNMGHERLFFLSTFWLRDLDKQIDI